MFCTDSLKQLLYECVCVVVSHPLRQGAEGRQSCDEGEIRQGSGGQGRGEAGTGKG